MAKYIARRLLLVIPILFGVTFIVSSLIYLTPGDPASVILGPNAREEAVQQLREKLDLDKPFLVRYLKWLGNALCGDLGRSWQRNEKVSNMLADRAPASLELALFAAIIGLGLSIPIGAIAAVYRNSIIDHAFMLFALFWVSMPSFWLAIVAILVFSLKLHLLPISGRGGPFWTLNGLRHLALPAFAMGIRQVAYLSRLTRTKMLEILGEDFIRTARSKGLPERLVVFRHALRNAMIPTITVFGLQIPGLFGLSVVIETVFSWPGIGKLLVDAVLKRDFPLVQGIVVLYTVIVILINLLVDVLYVYIDPRIKYE
ncbi:ABC transporter permease [Candidatus Bipolaricaulota bacterium]|nr:ABC transporter permease [Candidatus Bipolaricaulota bacterium]